MVLLSSFTAAVAIMAGSLAHGAPVSPEHEIGQLEEQTAMSAIVNNHEQRRTSNPIEDILDLQLCTNTNLAISAVLLSTIERILELGGNIDDNCDHMKAAILPNLSQCVMESFGISHTLYAGVVFDLGLTIAYSAVAGVYIDNEGRFGCFNTECQGFGLNVGVSVGAMAGILVGDSLNDFPGAGFGLEAGGDLGPGYDVAFGFTTGGNRPYAEISAGVGFSLNIGIHECETDTYGEVYVPNDYVTRSDTHCGGTSIDLADGTPYGWAPPNENKQLCEAKCTSDPHCEVFVWRDSDSSCFWKENYKTSSVYGNQDHDCHTPAWLTRWGRHCGGNNVVLADGTPYGWAPPNANERHCENRCNDDPQCEAFVWKESVNKCYWKKDVTRATLFEREGHHCYHRMHGYIQEEGYHCGGLKINQLDDGTPNDWHPPSGPEECSTKCRQDSDCTAFVWRQSDSSCHWKKDVNADSLVAQEGHTCYSIFNAPPPPPTPTPQPTPHPVEPWEPPSFPGVSPVGPPPSGSPGIMPVNPLRRFEQE